MKKVFLIFIVLSVFSNIQANNGKINHYQQLFYSEFSQKDAALINEAYRVQKLFGNELWKGWADLQIPILYITGEKEFAINFPKKMSGFEPISSPFLTEKNIQVRKRVFEKGLMASFDIEGIDTVVIGSPTNIKRLPSHWVLTAIHEMFHVYQTSHGSNQKIKTLRLGSETDAAWQLNFPFPYKDENLMRLIHLQSYPIYLGITDKEDADANYNLDIALDAIKVYRNFLKMQLAEGEQNYQYSKFQEWSEGIARYTEYKMAEMIAKSDYQPSLTFQRLKEFKNYKELWEEKYKNEIFLIKHAGQAMRSRTTFYYLGLGKGLLLDRLMPNWKSFYFKEDIWLDDLLSEVASEQK